jgi:hypothetical protein
VAAENGRGLSGFESGWTKARSGGKAIHVVHSGVEVGETIDWLFGTVDPHVLYIIIATNRHTNSSTANHLRVHRPRAKDCTT